MYVILTKVGSIFHQLLLHHISCSINRLAYFTSSIFFTSCSCSCFAILDFLPEFPSQDLSFLEIPLHRHRLRRRRSCCCCSTHQHSSSTFFQVKNFELDGSCNLKKQNSMFPNCRQVPDVCVSQCWTMTQMYIQ